MNTRLKFVRRHLQRKIKSFNPIWSTWMFLSKNVVPLLNCPLAYSITIIVFSTFYFSASSSLYFCVFPLINFIGQTHMTPRKAQSLSVKNHLSTSTAHPQGTCSSTLVTAAQTTSLVESGYSTLIDSSHAVPIRSYPPQFTSRLNGICMPRIK